MDNESKPCLFLRKSKGGKHLYAFGKDGILGDGVKSLLINVEDLQALLGGSEWCKVSAMREEDDLGTAEQSAISTGVETGLAETRRSYKAQGKADE